MNILCKNLILASMVTGLAVTASAAQVNGYLIDKLCSKKDAKTHTLQCALMDACQRSGYVVVTADGKMLSFDAKGNEEAIKALKALKKKDDIHVTVNGDVSGDSIKVASLKLM